MSLDVQAAAANEANQTLGLALESSETEVEAEFSETCKFK
jgi:hypothetical protein